jgi:hypothetical protein
MVKGTLTGLPFTFPGIILGNFFIILTAASFRLLSAPLAFIFPTLPSFSIIN